MGTWRIHSSLEEWEGVANKIEDELINYGFSGKFIVSLMLGMDEVIANITSYAYDNDKGNVVVKSEYETIDNQRTATVTFVDFGAKFNPLESDQEPDISENNVMKKKIGGLGIFLIKKQVDQLKYSYMENSNNLTLIKQEII